MAAAILWRTLECWDSMNPKNPKIRMGDVGVPILRLPDFFCPGYVPGAWVWGNSYSQLEKIESRGKLFVGGDTEVWIRRG